MWQAGRQAAQTAENLLYSIGNVAMAANNVGNMGPKAVAEKAAKEISKVLIFQHEETLLENRKKLNHHDNTKMLTTDKTKKPH